MTGEIWRRSRVLVAHLVGEVREVGEVGIPALIRSADDLTDPEAEGSGWSPKTVENVIRDLADFGVFRVVSRPGRDRSVRVSVLGEAWLARVLLPELGSSELRSAMGFLAERVEDPVLEEADAIAARLEAELLG